MEHPVTEVLLHHRTSAAPQHARGLELIGEYKGSGYKETTYLLRRSDGQVIQASHLIYLVASYVDGQSGYEQIAERVSADLGRAVSAESIRFVVEERLRPYGVIAREDGSVPERLERSSPLLGLRFRVGLVPERVVVTVASVFWPLFLAPVVVITLGGLLALDVWLLFFHGITQSVDEVIDQPLLILASSVLFTVATAFHEIGHASACRYGGAKPSKIGAGFYLVFLVFYSDVTDTYRLSKAGRLRTDLGGVYFDALFALLMAGAYFLTGFEPLLIGVVLIQLDILEEFEPFARFDGYYVVSDLTGVPDLFKYIKPVLKSLVPFWETDERVRELKPWARGAVGAWVLTTVPILLALTVVTLYWLPWLLANTWESFLGHYGETSGAFAAGRVLDGMVGLLEIGILLTPVAGGVLFAALAGKRLGAATWRWLRDLGWEAVSWLVPWGRGGSGAVEGITRVRAGATPHSQGE
jgi:putative peptide zinc metalloprotease protein